MPEQTRDGGARLQPSPAQSIWNRDPCLVQNIFQSLKLKILFPLLFLPLSIPIKLIFLEPAPTSPFPLPMLELRAKSLGSFHVTGGSSHLSSSIFVLIAYIFRNRMSERRASSVVQADSSVWNTLFAIRKSKQEDPFVEVPGLDTFTADSFDVSTSSSLVGRESTTNASFHNLSLRLMKRPDQYAFACALSMV